MGDRAHRGPIGGHGEFQTAEIGTEGKEGNEELLVVSAPFYPSVAFCVEDWADYKPWIAERTEVRSEDTEGGKRHEVEQKEPKGSLLCSVTGHSERSEESTRSNAMLASHAWILHCVQNDRRVSTPSQSRTRGLIARRFLRGLGSGLRDLCVEDRARLGLWLGRSIKNSRGY